MSWLLPTRTKRLIFLSTIFAGVKGINDPDVKMLNQLNTLLNLSSVDEAVALPMCFGDFLWRKRLADGIRLQHRKHAVLQLSEVNNKSLTQAEMRIVSNAIINATPCFLRYDSKTKMRADLFVLLEELPQFNCVKP